MNDKIQANPVHPIQASHSVPYTKNNYRTILSKLVYYANVLFSVSLMYIYSYMVYRFKDTFVTISTYRYIPAIRQSMGLLSFYRVAETDPTAFWLSLAVLEAYGIGVVGMWNGFLVPASLLIWGCLYGFLYYLESVSSFGFGYRRETYVDDSLRLCGILCLVTG
ncbi:hypothetical protein WA538_001087, partial [Blastocystis sp. DL]